MPKKITPKMRKWLQCYLDLDNVETFGNRTASAKAAGYKCGCQSGFECIGSQTRIVRLQITRTLNTLSQCSDKRNRVNPCKPG